MKESDITDPKHDVQDIEAAILARIVRPKTKTFPILDEYISTFERPLNFSFVLIHFELR